MKQFIFLLIGIFFIAFGCTEDLLDTDSILGNENLKHAEIKMVPIRGEIFGAVEEYTPQGFGIRGTMAGFFTHLGKLDEMNSIWENRSVDPSQLPLLSYVNDIVFCAANGDLVYATYYGVVNVQTLEASGNLVFEDGTGRFENVSGELVGYGYSERDESTGRLVGVHLEGEGVISNVGSSK